MLIPVIDIFLYALSIGERREERFMEWELYILLNRGLWWSDMAKKR